MGNQDFFCAPVIQHLCRPAAVIGAGQDLGLCGVGLEEVKIGKELLFGIPVVKIHLPIFIVAQKSLDIRRDHAALVQAGDERSGEISIEQAGQMV